MYSKLHNMTMSFIYMNWVFLEEYKLTPEEIADFMEQSWERGEGKMDMEERKKLMAAMERGRTVRKAEPPDWWIAAIRIIRSRTEYF